MAINSYQEANRINKKSLGELIREKAIGGNMGAMKSVTGAISDKMAAKSKGFKEKFDYLNIARMLMGNTMSSLIGRATGRKKEDIEYFANKGLKNKKGRANQVNERTIGNGLGNIEPALYTNVSDGQRGKMRRGDGVADVLSRLYNLIKSEYAAEAKKIKIEKKFKQKENKDKENWHKELLSALGGGGGKAVKIDKSGNAKEPSLGFGGFSGFGGGMLDGIMKMIENLTLMLAPLLSFLGAMGSSSLSSLLRLAGFLISPLGLGLLAAVVAGTIGKWMWEQIKLDPQAALRGEGGVGMAVSGLSSEGQLPSYEKEQADKNSRKTYKKVKKEGLEKSSLEDLKVAQQEMIDMGHLGAVNRVKKGVGDKKDEAIAKEYNDVVSAIESKSASKISPELSSQSNPPAPVASTEQSAASTAPVAMSESPPTATPASAESNPIAARAQSVISENINMMNQEYSGTQNIVVDASKKVNSVGGGQGVLLDTSVNVRTDDTTLQKILKQNLRPT
jgi:hypothetical protein